MGKTIRICRIHCRKSDKYAYTDASVAMGKHYTYPIEFIGADGPLGKASVGEVFAGARIFLPAVRR